MNKPQYLNENAPFITIDMAKARYNLCKEKNIDVGKRK